MPDLTYREAANAATERILAECPDECFRFIEPVDGWGATPQEIKEAIDLVGMILYAQIGRFDDLSPLSILRVNQNRISVMIACRVLASLSNMADEWAKRYPDG